MTKNKLNSAKAQQDDVSANRRDFLKKSALVGLAAVLNPVTSFATETNLLESVALIDVNTDVTSQTITILITTDIHSQLNTHDEFFWENNQAVYKKRGGMAVLKTMIESFKKENPNNTIVYDGGDFFSWARRCFINRGRSLDSYI